MSLWTPDAAILVEDLPSYLSGCEPRVCGVQEFFRDSREWHAWRKKRVTASLVVALLGHGHKSASEALAEWESEREPPSPPLHFRVAHHVEAEVCRELGAAHVAHAVWTVERGDIGASLDGIFFDANSRPIALCEVKHRTYGWDDYAEGGCKVSDAIQCRTQQLITGLPVVLAAYVGQRVELRVFDDRDPAKRDACFERIDAAKDAAVAWRKGDHGPLLELLLEQMAGSEAAALLGKQPGPVAGSEMLGWMLAQLESARDASRRCDLAMERIRELVLCRLVEEFPGGIPASGETKKWAWKWSGKALKVVTKCGRRDPRDEVI